MMNKFLAWIGFKQCPDYEAQYRALLKVTTRDIFDLQFKLANAQIELLVARSLLDGKTVTRVHDEVIIETPLLSTGRKPSVPEIQNFPTKHVWDTERYRK